jgi:hypothetical protein
MRFGMMSMEEGANLSPLLNSGGLVRGARRVDLRMVIGQGVWRGPKKERIAFRFSFRRRSHGCWGSLASIAVFSIFVDILRPAHLSWLLDHWSQLAKRLPELLRDGKGAGGGGR